MHNTSQQPRNDRYRNGRCVDCGTEPYSPGRPRCEHCHQQHAQQPPIVGARGEPLRADELPEATYDHIPCGEDQDQVVAEYVALRPYQRDYGHLLPPRNEYDCGATYLRHLRRVEAAVIRTPDLLDKQPTIAQRRAYAAKLSRQDGKP